MTISDSDLTQKIKNGDHYAFRDLFYRHSVRLCKFAYSLIGDQASAEDIVQNFFITYWLKRESLTFSPSFLSYAYQSIYNASLNHLRDSKKFVYEFIDNLMVVEESITKDELLSKEDQLSEAINQLPPRCKEIFLMAKVDRKSYEEIASNLLISENTVKAQISKAYKLLRKSLVIIILSFI